MQTHPAVSAITPSISLTLPAEPKLRSVAIGEVLYSAGEEGIAWRVKTGAVRLDRVSGSSEGEVRSFAGLALAGDVIGAETLLFGQYSFEAHALGDVTLERWLAPNTALSGESLLQTLAAAERRAADALALRVGDAFERVRQLILLLARERSHLRNQAISIPGLRDIADMTGLTVETVSRAISHLRKSGLLQKYGRRSAVIFPQSVTAVPA
jgi:CRP-like cAMP-binding protein